MVSHCFSEPSNYSGASRLLFRLSIMLISSQLIELVSKVSSASVDDMRAATSSNFAQQSSVYLRGYTSGCFARFPRLASHLANLATKLLLRPVLVKRGVVSGWVARDALWSIGLRLVALVAVAAGMSGCFKLTGGGRMKPPERPSAMLEYYKLSASFGDYREELQYETDTYLHKHITIESYAGPITVEYFQNKGPRSDNLVFVFPVLGGKNFIEKHIATYFVEAGIDAAIVTRSNEFKEPAKFDQLEEIFRLNVVRDRLAIDFFESEYGKTKFGTFGISRGAINVALTAGIDARLKYNVLVMGGTDLVNLFNDSDQPRINKYIRSVCDVKGFTQEQFLEALRTQLRTDPKHTAHYLDGKNSLLILGIFDKTVPFTYGLKLRNQIGRPDTIFLAADHYLGLLFTQTVSFLPPSKEGGWFPFPYVEEEALAFYRRSFEQSSSWKVLPYRILQLPLNLMAEGIAYTGAAFEALFGSSDTNDNTAETERFWREACEAGSL